MGHRFMSAQRIAPKSATIPQRMPVFAQSSVPATLAAPVTLRTAPGVDLVHLQPDTLAMAQDLSTWSLMQGWELEFTSGFRDPTYQLQLRARWDAGDRQGLRVRPARSSAHSRGEAVDGVILEDPAGKKLARLGQYAQLRGYTWGGTFSDPDPIHFAIGGPRRE